MSGYKRILLAVDLAEESSIVGERAVQLARLFDAQLHVVHVVEPLSLVYGGDIPMDMSSVQDQIQEQAQSSLDDFCEAAGVPDAHRYLIFGRPETEIHRIAMSADIDAIVVGSHGRQGLALLLGSTANGVLHGASCDVLAVRVGPGAHQQSAD